MAESGDGRGVPRELLENIEDDPPRVSVTVGLSSHRESTLIVSRDLNRRLIVCQMFFCL